MTYTMDHSSNNGEFEALNKSKIEEYAGAIAFTVSVIVFGIIGNIMSVVFYGFKVPKTSTHAIITWLALVDLTACILFSYRIIELCYTVTFKNKPGCKIIQFLTHWIDITSGVMLFVVAFDRYLKICRPFGWQFSIKSAKIALLIIVIAAMVQSLSYLVTMDVVHVNVTEADSGKTIKAFYCTHSKDPALKTTITVFHALDILIFIVVFFGCIVLYILISRALWLSRNNIKHAYKGKGSSADGQQERKGTSIWFEGVRSTEETSFSETQTGFTKNGAVKSTMEPSRLSSIHNKISHEQLDSNADPNYVISGETAAVRDKDTYFKINAHGEDIPSDKDRTLVTFQSNNGPKYNRDTRHHARRTKQYPDERKITLMMIVITIASVFSFVPYFIVSLTVKQNENTIEQEFSVGIQIAIGSFMLNNAVNPYIIGLFNSKFRQFLKNIFCKCIGRNRF